MSASALAADVTYNQAGALIIPGQTVTGNLSATATGIISQNGALTVAGTSMFYANGNAIALVNAGNDFQGAVTLTGGASQITDSNDLTLGSVNVASLSVVAAGRIGLTQDETTIGVLNYSAVGGVVLNNDVTLTFPAYGTLSGDNIDTADHNLTIAPYFVTINNSISGTGSVTFIGAGGTTLLGDTLTPAAPRSRKARLLSVTAERRVPLLAMWWLARP